MERAETLNHSTQTFKVLDEKTKQELLTLGNMFLHASYWYLALSANAKFLNLPGFAWAMIENEKKCKDAAFMIMTFVKDHGGILEFADIARPKYDENEVTAEFICRRWDDIENWLANKITEFTKEFSAKAEIMDLLNNLQAQVKHVYDRTK